MTTASPRWAKSSHSDNGGQCVEVAANLATTHGIIPVRDSENPSGPQLAVATGSFASFLVGVAGGRFFG
ncbi:DUF397 domain-containing protein [Streptomyces sp. AJS327]|uniref:DUF397 domain-containing protein n=1 Tax=Streptomyces sp. AJS327 TaxID=2545265 RepID=UPI0027E53927|nr:DUF397 domain-containing protein [Streptomyces sp. AJS327]